MNKKPLLLLVGALALSLASASFAAAPPMDDRMDRGGADFQNAEPAKPDPKVGTTSGKTRPGTDGGVKNDRIGEEGADFRNDPPAKPDPKVGTTSGKNHSGADSGIKNDSMGGEGSDFKKSAN